MTLYDITAICVFVPISYYSHDQETLISTLGVNTIKSNLKIKKRNND